VQRSAHLLPFPPGPFESVTHTGPIVVYQADLLDPKLEDAGMTDWIQHDGAGHLVLVVDDDSGIRSYIKTILQSADVHVLEAGDGLEALEVFQVWRGRIDLVITDIRMPRMTGTDLAISLRSDCPAIPLIFVSAEPAPMDMNDPKKGFFFIEKPFSPKVLLEAAHQFFN
jgi:CheY-like chemotaxis protein